jgi:hypothetical protein
VSFPCLIQYVTQFLNLKNGALGGGVDVIFFDRIKKVEASINRIKGI